jgi:hypothetical protein
VGSIVKVYNGMAPWDLHLCLTNKTAKVAQVGKTYSKLSGIMYNIVLTFCNKLLKLLLPIPHALIIYGVGVNYKPHITEAA